MTTRKKILFSILLLLVLLFSHGYTYYLADEKAQLRAFIVEADMDTTLLKALDENKTDLVKNILTWSSHSLFYDIGKNGNVERYLSICKRIDNNRIELLQRNGIFEDSNCTDEELIEVKRITNLGIKNIKKLCKIK